MGEQESERAPTSAPPPVGLVSTAQQLMDGERSWEKVLVRWEKLEESVEIECLLVVGQKV